MPKSRVRTKAKTRKSVAKRIKRVTRTGKVIARSQTSQHLAARKSNRTRAQSGQSKVLPKVQAANIKSQLGK